MNNHVYRIAWRDGTPYVQVGTVYFVGRKTRQRRIRTKDGTAFSPTGFQQTVGDAFRYEIERLATVCSASWSGRKPTDLFVIVPRLLRLRGRLRRNGIQC